ncbi:Uncharacterised protein [Candidatus Burarchaeum australiense]|nr:Uncharacterised protein [Candidatus Burarchaeum australiense]
MDEELEPLWLSVVAAPWRFMKGIFHRIRKALPITDYGLGQYEKDKQEVQGELSDVLRSQKELERKIADMEKETKEMEE